MKRIQPVMVVLLATLLAACSGLQPPQQTHLQGDVEALRDCAHWFARLDASVARTGVGDVGARRINGYPYLRTDRFGDAFRTAVLSDPRLGRAWLQYLQRLDTEGRRIEIANLPAVEIEAFGGNDRTTLLERVADCASRLASTDLADAQPNEQLVQRARVEDDYSNTKRALGLYELTRLPFHAGVQGWQERAREAISRTRGGEPPRYPLRRYRPPEMAVYSRAQVRSLLDTAAAHPLGIVDLTPGQRDRLFATYAPRFEVEDGGDFDRIGRLRWGGDGLPVLDTEIPTLYRRLDYTRVDGRTLLQLVYVAWFSERPAEHAFDLLAGRLDGLVWRVTLAADGAPVLFDSIHPCGCYHQFIPTPRAVALPVPEGAGEWAFVPTELPLPAETDRVTVSLQSRTHYLRDVNLQDVSGGQVYQFADYDELRSLPLPGGGHRSLFASDGLVRGTERGERFFFWPMGIKSAGAMRQAGSQPTAFVGRRHFDEFDLIQKRFRILDSLPAD